MDYEKKPLASISMLFIALIFAVSLFAFGGSAPAPDVSEPMYGAHHGEFDYVVYMPASRFFFETTLEGLERRATNIVRGRIMNDARMVLRVNGRITTGNNLVSFEIYEVIKGDLSVGDVITISEPYYIVDRRFFTHSNYMPSIPYQEYIFFLSEQRTAPSPPEFVGIFPVIHGDRGRYRVPSGGRAMEAYTASELSVGTAGNFDLYMYLWRAVIEAFVD
jgi:hypothetical protein